MRSIRYAAVLLVWTAVARPDGDVAVTCGHDTNPNAIFIRTRGDFVLVDVVLRRGARAVPLHDEGATAEKLPELQAKAGLVESLGRRWSLRWPKSSCSLGANGHLLCSKGKDWQEI